MRRVWVAIPCAVLTAACGAGSSPPTPTPTPAPPAPALIQVENLAAARPQSGLGAADVVYEYVTEGGISRFSAIFLHPPSTRVGPIRSARLVTIRLTQHYGAVLIYSGASTYVQQHVEQSGVHHFTETTAGAHVFRVGNRVVPHNLYTDGTGIGALVAQAGAPPVAWHLWTRVSKPPTTGPMVPSFQVPISFGETPTWTFDPANNGYTRREPDTGPFINADNRQPVVASTVVVQQVVVSVAPEVEDVSGAHGMEQNIDSGGPAQVFTGGHEFDVRWSQPAKGPPVFALPNGSPAPIAPGLVWIELVPVGNRAS